MRLQIRPKPLAQQGFTIVELMIATLVFSVILLVITAGVVSFTHSYYKGLNAATTQTTARNAMDAVSQAIQFGGGGVGFATMDPATRHGAYCFGSVQFDYIIGSEVNTAVTGAQGLWETPWDSTTPCTINNFVSGSQQLLTKSMRLTDFSVVVPGDGPELYPITLDVSYGDNDLLCSTSLNGHVGGCDKSDPSFPLTITGDAAIASVGATIQCKIVTGSQFCAFANLTSTVQRRVQ